MELPSNSKRLDDGLTSLSSYRLDLAYVGTDFMGWQSQPHRNTVQDRLEGALSIILREKVSVVGASRTDTGVHAEHQVAVFRTHKKIDIRKVHRSLQSLLGPSIGISSLEITDPSFHPILSSHAKIYRYRLWCGPGVNPFLADFSLHFPKKLDLEAMQTASQYLLGKHNFKCFCASDGSAKTFERTILDYRWVHDGNQIDFYILGDGFLKQMVRTIVGTLLDVGVGKRASSNIEFLLDHQDRTLAGKTAPAQGLSLLKLYFEPITTIPDRVTHSIYESTLSRNPD